MTDDTRSLLRAPNPLIDFFQAHSMEAQP
jgi:hypothetical protein